MKGFSKKRFLHALFFSYVVFLAFSIVTGIFLLRSSLETIEQNTAQFSRIALSKTSDFIDQAESEMQNLLYGLRARQEYSSLAYAEAPINNAKREKVATLQNEMVRQAAYSNFVSRILIWFDYPQLSAGTSDFANSQESFDRILQSRFGMSFDEVASLAAENQGKIYLHALGEGGSVEKMIAITSYHHGNRSSIEVLELKVDALKKLFAGKSKEEDATFFWASTNAGGLLLLPPGGEKPLAQYVQSLELIPGEIARVSYEGQELAVMCTERKGFTVYSAIDFPAYSETLDNYRSWAVVYLLVYLAVSIMIALFFSKRNYRPVERLTSTLGNHGAVSDTEGEFAVLEAGINLLLKYSREYSRAQVKEEKRLLEQELVQALRGEMTEADFSGCCERNGLVFSSDRFAVVGMTVRDCGGLFFGEGPNPDRDSADICGFAAASVTGEFLEQLGSAYTCRHDGKIWAIVSPEISKIEAERELEALLRGRCQTAGEFLKKELGIDAGFCTSLISLPHAGLPGIAVAYHEALWGLEQMESYRMEETVCGYREIVALLKAKGLRPSADLTTKRRQFYSAVISGDLEEADRLYLELRRQDISMTDESFSAVRTQTSALMGYLLSNLPASCLERHSGEIEEIVRAVRNEQHDDQLIDRMHRWMIFFQGLHREATEGQEPHCDVAEVACEYINDHFADMDISVAEVAESLKISPSYLTRVFRKKYGVSAFDYIHRRRMDTAKLLLREGGATVELVAEQVGYSGALALIRAFKRMEGCTPTEYRRSLQQKGE